MKKHQIEAIKFYKAFEELAENTDNFESFDIKKIVIKSAFFYKDFILFEFFSIYQSENTNKFRFRNIFKKID